MDRRRAFQRLGTAALLSTLAACGFRLRGTQQLQFQTIYLGFSPNSPLGAELARNIRTGTNAAVVTDIKQAQALLDVLGEAKERDVLSLDAQGRAREYTLRYRLAFQLRDKEGTLLIPPTQIAVQREVSFNETQILAKESEEALLYRDMQTDLVQQVLRRIAAAKMPG